MGFPHMIRSMLSLLLILIGIPLIAAALHGDSTVITTQEARLHGLYAGAVLVIAGFIIGKYWSLKWDYQGSGARAEAEAARAAAAAQKRLEPVEEQIDLFEPRNRA